MSKHNRLNKGSTQYSRAEFATELDRPEGIPKPRESDSQVSQFKSGCRLDEPSRHDKKSPMKDKQV